MDADEEFHFQRERLGSWGEPDPRTEEGIREAVARAQEAIGRMVDEMVFHGIERPARPAPLEDGAFVITDAPLPPQRKEVL